MNYIILTIRPKLKPTMTPVEMVMAASSRSPRWPANAWVTTFMVKVATRLKMEGPTMYQSFFDSIQNLDLASPPAGGCNKAWFSPSSPPVFFIAYAFWGQEIGNWWKRKMTIYIGGGNCLFAHVSFYIICGYREICVESKYITCLYKLLGNSSVHFKDLTGVY